MSTVLPPAAALPLLVALPLLLLLLLLQPTAANAIAVRAAMAVVRLMIFLSFVEVVRLPRSALTGLVCACGLWPCGLAAAGRGRSDEVIYGGGTVQGSIPARIPGRANVAVGTSVGDFPPGAEQTGPPLVRGVPARSVSINSAKPIARH